MPRALRSNRGRSNSASTRCTALVSADWVTPSSSAAAESRPVLATAREYSISRIDKGIPAVYGFPPGPGWGGGGCGGVVGRRRAAGRAHAEHRRPGNAGPAVAELQRRKRLCADTLGADDGAPSDPHRLPAIGATGSAAGPDAARDHAGATVVGAGLCERALRQMAFGRCARALAFGSRLRRVVRNCAHHRREPVHLDRRL